jgi:hypothetical protein
VILSHRKEQTVLVHAPSGSFAACAQLFTQYPLAVTHDCADRGFRSMVLMNHDVGPSGFFVLTQVSHDLFVIRSWHHQHGVSHAIRPEEPVSGIVHRVIVDSLPVPRDGALLGWVTDSQVTVMLAAYCRQSATLDIPAPVPEILVMPMAGTNELAHWPPIASTPFDWRLWEYIERGQIVDIVPVLTHGLGRAYWVPSLDRRSARHEDGCVVIRDHLPADDWWVPAGVYMDHWILREGFDAPPVTRLLALPGVVDLARRFR